MVFLELETVKEPVCFKLGHREEKTSCFFFCISLYAAVKFEWILEKFGWGLLDSDRSDGARGPDFSLRRS